MSKIVVFGSVNVDYVAQVERLPGPGETIKTDHYEALPGGKGANQALAAALREEAVEHFTMQPPPGFRPGPPGGQPPPGMGPPPGMR